MNKKILNELSDIFENELMMYIFHNKKVYERLTKRYLKKNKIDYPLGQTFDEYIYNIKIIETSIYTLKRDLIEIFIEDKTISEPFFVYLYNVYIDEYNLPYKLAMDIRNRLHFDE